MNLLGNKDDYYKSIFMTIKTASPRSQNMLILKHLMSGKTITPLQALEKFGCLRLSGRIHNLRACGYNIISEPFKTGSGKIVSKYRMAK